MVAGACEPHHDGKVRINICISRMLKVSFTFWSFRLLPIGASAGAERLIVHRSVSFSYAGTSSTHSSVQAHRTREHTWFQPTAVHSASHNSHSLYGWAEREVSWRVSGVPALAAGYKCYTCSYLLGYQCFLLLFWFLYLHSAENFGPKTGPKRNIWQMALKPKSD